MSIITKGEVINYWKKIADAVTGNRLQVDAQLTGSIPQGNNRIGDVMIPLAINRYSKNNPGLGNSNASDWELRTTASKFYRIDHHFGLNSDVFAVETMIALKTTLDVTHQVRFQLSEVFDGEGATTSGNLTPYVDIPAGGGTLLFVPEKGISAPSNFYEIPELRGLFRYFTMRINITGGVAPVSGEVKINVYQRGYAL